MRTLRTQGPWADAENAALSSSQLPLCQEVWIPIVSDSPGQIVRWDEIPRGLELVREGTEVNYKGITGNLSFSASGNTNQRSMRYSFEVIRGARSEFEAYEVCASQ